VIQPFFRLTLRVRPFKLGPFVNQDLHSSRPCCSTTVKVIVCSTTRTAKTSRPQQWRRLTWLDRFCSSSSSGKFVTTKPEMICAPPSYREALTNARTIL
jgi:hypothetical protein